MFKTFHKGHIIQILTGSPGRSCNITFPVDCQESYIFPRDYIAPRENITIFGTTGTCDISSVPVDICYIRLVKMDDFGALWLPQSLVTRLQVCIQNKLNANLTVLLWRSIVNHCVLCLRSAFLSGSVSSIWNWCYCCCCLYFLLNCLYFPGQYNSVFDLGVYARLTTWARETISYTTIIYKYLPFWE